MKSLFISLWLILALAILLPRMASAIEPVALSQVSSFSSEWCNANTEALTTLTTVPQIETVCWGQVQFQSNSVRAVSFILKDGSKSTFIEGDFETVDLFHLNMDLYGPLRSAQLPIVAGQAGHAQLLLDGNGEVIGVEGLLGLARPFAASKP